MSAGETTHNSTSPLFFNRQLRLDAGASAFTAFSIERNESEDEEEAKVKAESDETEVVMEEAVVKVNKGHFRMQSKIVRPQPLPTTSTPVKQIRPSSIESARNQIRQLESQITFVKGQHAEMLVALHEEIESLKSRNRDLQFELVMNYDYSPKEVAQLGRLRNKTPPTTAGEEEDKDKVAKSSNDRQLLQLERNKHLEANRLHEQRIKSLGEEIGELRERNEYLTKLVQEQQRSRYLREEEDRKKSAQMNDMAKKLSEAEMTISLLKMENSNQRSELSELKSSIERNAKMKFRGCNHPSKKLRKLGGSISSLSSRTESLERFPPLRESMDAGIGFLANSNNNNFKGNNNNNQYYASKALIDPEFPPLNGMISQRGSIDSGTLVQNLRPLAQPLSSSSTIGPSASTEMSQNQTLPSLRRQNNHNTTNTSRKMSLRSQPSLEPPQHPQKAKRNL